MAEIPRDERRIREVDVFNALDRTRCDLTEVHRSFEAEDLPGAKRALVEHFRVRQYPRWFFDLRDGSQGDMPSPWSSSESYTLFFGPESPHRGYLM